MRTIRKLAGTVVVCGLVLLPVYVLTWAVVVAFRWTDFRGSHLVSEKRYATTDGVIVSSEIVRRGRSHAYRIEYEFEVRGARHRSQQVSFGNRGGYYYALGYVARYPAGNTVRVFYDRARPDFAVLEPSTRTDFLTPLWVPFVPFLLGCAALLLLPRGGQEAGGAEQDAATPAHPAVLRLGKELELLERERKSLESVRSDVSRKSNDQASSSLGAVASPFRVGRPWRAVPEHDR